MMQDTTNEVAVRGESGVVPVFDMGAAYFVAALVGAFARSSRFDISAARKEFVADMAVIGDPESGKLGWRVAHCRFPRWPSVSAISCGSTIQA